MAVTYTTNTIYWDNGTPPPPKYPIGFQFKTSPHNSAIWTITVAKYDHLDGWKYEVRDHLNYKGLAPETSIDKWSENPVEEVKRRCLNPM